MLHVWPVIVLVGALVMVGCSAPEPEVRAGSGVAAATSPVGAPGPPQGLPRSLPTGLYEVRSGDGSFTERTLWVSDERYFSQSVDSSTGMIENFAVVGDTEYRWNAGPIIDLVGAGLGDDEMSALSEDEAIERFGYGELTVPTARSGRAMPAGLFEAGAFAQARWEGRVVTNRPDRGQGSLTVAYRTDGTPESLTYRDADGGVVHEMTVSRQPVSIGDMSIDALRCRALSDEAAEIMEKYPVRACADQPVRDGTTRNG